MSKLVKEMVISELQKRLGANPDMLVIDSSKLDALSNNKLRLKLHEKGITILNVKNTLANKALGELGVTALTPFLKGPSALVFGGPDMVALSINHAEQAGVGDKVKFVKADIFQTDFSQATVITMYLLPSLNIKLRPKILEMRPGTRVVSHAFNMEDWEPDQTATVDGRDAYLWIVPAKVAGHWKLSVPAGSGTESWDLALEQRQR